MSNIDQHSQAVIRERAGIPRFAYLLTACIGVIGSNSLAFGPIAPEVARSLGVGVPSVMTASAVFGLGTAGSAMLLGRLIDRHGAARMLRIALLLLALGLAASGLAPVLVLLVAAQFVVGVAAGIALPTIYTLAAAVAPPGRESQTIGVVLTGWTLSMVAGVSLSAVIADLVGWRFVFAVMAAGAFAVSGVVWRTAPHSEGAAETISQSPVAALRVPGVVPLLGACAVFMASFYGVYAYIGDHVHATLGLTVSANSLIAVAYGLGFGGAVFFDPLIDRFGAARLLAPIFLCVGAIFVAMAALSDSYAGMLLAVFAWGLANHFGLNVLIMRLTALAPARRGAIMGLNSAVTYVALFVGTTGFGAFYGVGGFAALPCAAAALMLGAAALAVLAHRPFRPCAIPD
ncbi:MFS transporter [Mesorhizobium sp. CAU 1732]|uniref:MFS transporter n=1 Tax=Mesorhizobium sp. CAU 1732 TaxID=3140358 RepID=UPI003261B32F